MGYRFHISSHYVSVNDKFLLSAICRQRDQRTWSSTTIKLNDFLGNDNGVFKWDSQGFGAEAKDIRLIDRHILSARLKLKDGSWTKKPVTVDLAERIENLNGTLHCHSG